MNGDRTVCKLFKPYLRACLSIWQENQEINYAVIAVYKENSELGCFFLTIIVSCSFKVMAAIDFSSDLEDFRILKYKIVRLIKGNL